MPSPHDPPPEPFFEPLPPPEQFDEPPAIYVQVPWQPPQNVVPLSVPVSIELARTADTVVAMTGMEVYPQGVSYTVHSWMRPGTEPKDDAGGPYVQWAHEPRIGWLLEDGSKVGATLEAPGDDLERTPLVPRVAGQGGTGGGIHGAMQHWLYPIPRGDRWTVVTEWLARGIPETRLEFDASPIHAAAAASAGELWELPTPPEGSEYGWFAYAPMSGSSYSSHVTLQPDRPEDDKDEEADG